MISLENEAKIQQVLELALKKSFCAKKNVQKFHLDFMSTFIMALLSSKNVQYHSIAACISGEALEGSKVRRTQRFMSEFDLYFYSVADFLLNLLPKKGKITFCLDRTEWQFGEFTHNMLVLTAYSHRVGIPIWFEPVNENGGCSAVNDRIYTILCCLQLVEKERIHLQDAVRMRKLFALISMAFVVAFRAGLEVNKHTPIPIKNHGYKENSFFRKGRDFLRNLDASRGKSKKIKERKIKEFEIIFQSLCEIILKVFKI